MLQRLPSHLRDSDALLTELRQIQPSPQHRLFTFDAVSLYTNIPTGTGIATIETMLKEEQHRFENVIVQGLRYIMNENLFTFGDCVWKQIKGTAMGTPCAPTYASLYVAYHERSILREFSNYIVLYKRYIDDVFLIWQDGEDPRASDTFKIRLNTIPGLRWTNMERGREAPFLDLKIRRSDTRYETRTHEKELNLYLYIAAQSAHRPGVLKGLIIGIVQKYYRQNTRTEDFQSQVRAFFKRLAARGYNSTQLRDHFREAIERVAKLQEEAQQTTRPTTEVDKPKQVFLSVPYDPNGPTRKHLRAFYQADRIEDEFAAHNIKITVCYNRPRNLRDLLCPSEFKANIYDVHFKNSSEDAMH
ncbi:hypothetical protein ATCC90586_011374 [Pythium insidiosum]|nr:hypothetical protein ATCC90586_011374 [Pythium insidiosum]